MSRNKGGLGTTPVVKKAIRIKLSGEQDFRAEKKELSPEIAQMASQRLHGTVAKAKTVTDDDVSTVADKVEVKKAIPAPEVAPEEVVAETPVEEQAGENAGESSENQEGVTEETDIRETTHISAEEAEAIKALAEQAEEMQKADFLKGKLDEVQEELGKTIALNEKLEEDIRLFVSIADELLEDLPEEKVADFMKTSSAELYRKIVEKYKA